MAIAAISAARAEIAYVRVVYAAGFIGQDRHRPATAATGTIAAAAPATAGAVTTTATATAGAVTPSALTAASTIAAAATVTAAGPAILGFTDLASGDIAPVLQICAAQLVFRLLHSGLRFGRVDREHKRYRQAGCCNQAGILEIEHGLPLLSG
jgi:hypothetical protein